MVRGSAAESVAATPQAANRPLRRDAERNRQRILQAAREVFAARGIDVTLDDIARHAGLGVGTVYRRYPSREHLVEALFDTELDRIVAWTREGLHHRDPWTGLTQALERAADSLAADRGLRDVLFSHEYGRDRVAKVREQIAPVMDALIERCQQAGVVRADAVGSDIALVQFMIASLIEYTEHVEPGLWRRYLTICLDGLRATPSTLPTSAPDDEKLAQIAQQWHPAHHRSPE